MTAPTRRKVLAGMAVSTVAAAVAGAVPTAALASPDAHLFAVAAECDRLHEVWKMSCKAYSDAEGPVFDKRHRGKPASDAEIAKLSKAETQNDVDQSAYISIERRLLGMPAHTPQGLAIKLRTFRLYHADTEYLAPFVDGFIADAERIGGAI